ncbi:MAG TPA: type II toxin-antitoxin system PemK/MazF family toxin [Gemmataceae bacterium]|jgi:mRNA interferase MazF|nr:type II toxin-antitoxin system PemK/MazF family toxin [Gemmataceae bacterium]
MSVHRGDIVIVDWPFTAGGGTKPRPALVIQNDRDNARLTNTIVVMITSRSHRAGEPTQVLIDISTLDGRQTGLHRTSVVNCINLFTVEQAKVLQTIGHLSAALIQQSDVALKVALQLT